MIESKDALFDCLASTFRCSRILKRLEKRIDVAYFFPRLVNLVCGRVWISPWEASWRKLCVMFYHVCNRIEVLDWILPPTFHDHTEKGGYEQTKMQITYNSILMTSLWWRNLVTNKKNTKRVTIPTYEILKKRKMRPWDKTGFMILLFFQRWLSS